MATAIKEIKDDEEPEDLFQKTLERVRTSGVSVRFAKEDTLIRRMYALEGLTNVASLEEETSSEKEREAAKNLALGLKDAPFLVKWQQKV